MKMTSAGHDLSEAWRSAIRAGKIVNEFETSEKHRVAFGLTIRDGGIAYFAKNLTTGSPVPATVEERTIPGTAFRIQYNGYRALRPGGNPRFAGRQPNIPVEADKCRFYCQDPSQPLSILNRDPLAQVALTHNRWSAYYSAVPFEKEGHFLWMPAVVDGARTVLPHHPQHLTRPILEDMLTLFRRSESMLVFFNALHAGASVNHIHLQSVFHGGRLAIEEIQTSPSSQAPECRLLKGDGANGLVFGPEIATGPLFSAVDRLQSKGIPFNLILLGERIFLIPRKADHEVVPEFPGGVVASMELAGKIITGDQDVFNRINSDSIRTVFGKVTLPVTQALPEYA